MRRLIDLQACVTEGSRGRGVGRYSESFARAITDACSGDDLSLSLNGNYRAESVRLAREFDRHAPRVRLSYYRYPEPTQLSGKARAHRVRVGEEIITSHWMSLHPDVLHVSHCFEGLGDDAIVPRMLPRVPGLLTSATLFDLIPLRFPEHYLADATVRSWYLEKVATLRQFDLLAAISETSRRDAIELLGIPEHRIVTVWGGVGPQFCPGEVSDELREQIHNRYGIERPFLLYTGGDDFRKNLDGALAAFVELPSDLRSQYQFVIVCSIRAEKKRELLCKAESLGVAPHSIVFTDFVPEADLVALYRLCTLFIFPSLYEGLGLPVLEAMACGAPVIGSNNSSVKDLIVLSDAMFDASRTDRITAKLAQVLGNQDMRKALRQHGLERSRQFTWTSCATAYSSAVDDLRKQASTVTLATYSRMLPRRRLALFSPLPPARSGIADHTSLLLPHLLEYFDIEVFIDVETSGREPVDLGVPVRSHTEFEQCWRSFDLVMFEFGNSEFHAYMLSWLRRLPGVVTLHDAYLSGLFAYISSSADSYDAFSLEMLYSHGPRARRRLTRAGPNGPVWDAMIELPCTKSVLDDAIGVIAHSAFNSDVSQQHYPEGWAAPFRIVPQVVRPRRKIDGSSRALLRRVTGYADDSFVVATFGHIAWTKCGDRLLEAFELAAPQNSLIRLVFVGELAADDFGRALHGKIESSAYRERIHVTGFLQPAQFDDYLQAADIAFQLRKNSRGGTPKGVLDCMSFGLPVCVNDEASYRDYPDNVLVKLNASPSTAELEKTMLTFSRNSKRLREIGEAGRRHAQTLHEPMAVAAAYALAINEFLQRQQYASRNMRVARLAALTRAEIDDGSRAEVAKALEFEWQQRPFSRQRLLIDVTHLASEDHGTGIPRVVKAMLRHLYVSDRTGFEPIAVRLNDHGVLEEAAALLKQLQVGLLVERNSPVNKLINAVAGDVVLLLDSSWSAFDRYRPVLESARAAGATVVMVVYDLIPVRMPHLVPAGGAAWFKEWVQKALQCSDAALCISRTTADDLIAFIDECNVPIASAFRVGYWHLGADIEKAEAQEASNDAMSLALGRPAFLMVGTIEPRKRHALALEAMEILWNEGLEVNLLIAGKKGWIDDEFMNRLGQHAEAGNRLHLFQSTGDEALEHLYQKSTALLFPSVSEGFGLPLVEAAKFGLPVICSSIPAFREIAGSHAFYANTDDATSLANSLREWLSLRPSGRLPDSRKIPWQNWEQSAEQLLDVVIGNRWYKSFANDGQVLDCSAR